MAERSRRPSSETPSGDFFLRQTDRWPGADAHETPAASPVYGASSVWSPVSGSSACDSMSPPGTAPRRPRVLPGREIGPYIASPRSRLWHPRPPACRPQRGKASEQKGWFNKLCCCVGAGYTAGVRCFSRSDDPIVREGRDPRPARLSCSVGFGWTTTQLFNFFRAPESFHDADEVVAVRCIAFNLTRDASHVRVHSFSLTSKILLSSLSCCQVGVAAACSARASSLSG